MSDSSRALTFTYPNQSPNVNPALSETYSWGVGELKFVEYSNPSMGGGITIGFNQVAGSTIGSANSPGAVVVRDDSTFVSVGLSSSTASGAVSKLDNRTLTSSSYIFVGSSDQCAKIFSGQCDRVGNFFF